MRTGPGTAHAASSLSPGSADAPMVLHARVVTGAGGGPEKTILNSPRFLRRLGYDAVCAYLHPPGDPGYAELCRRADDARAEIVSIPDRGPWDAGVLRRLLRLCRDRRVSIWHGHDYKSNLLGLLLGRLHPMHLVTTVHGWVHHTHRTPLYYGIDRFCLRRYERVVCVSPDLHEACLSHGVPPDRCVLIENAIDTESWTRRLRAVEARRRLGVPERFTIGAVGRLAAEKGFDLLIEAVQRLLERGHDLTLLIAGDGPERERLERLVAPPHRNGRIRLVGFLSDARSFYESLDLFVLSSLREGLPNVLLEAMACGVPVAATRVAGVPRLIRDGVNGRLVEPSRVDALGAAIADLASDAALRARFAAAGRATVEARYSFDVRMRKMASLYDDLLRHASLAPDESLSPNRRTELLEHEPCR